MNFVINRLKFKYFKYLLKLKNLIILNLNKKVFFFFFNFFYNIFLFNDILLRFFFIKSFIIFDKKIDFTFFFLNFYKYIHIFYNLYYIEFFLDGIYYRIKYYKELNIIGFILGYNHYVLIYLPMFINIKLHLKKRRFFFYSFFKNLLSLFANQIVNLKFPNLFKGMGIKIVNYNYRLKKLKKKK